MQIFKLVNIRVIATALMLYKIFTKEGGINYDEIISKGGRKICQINKYCMYDVLVGTSTKNASISNKKGLISYKK